MEENLLELTADIVSAYVGKNQVPASDLAALITDVSAALQRVWSPDSAEAATKPRPAVTLKKSLHDDFLVCLEDGKKFKSLKRHLLARHGMTPEAYRSKWGLASDYPMVAPTYSVRRSVLASEMGLGTSRAMGSRAKASREERKQNHKGPR